jgi:hypothetical protein
MFIKFVKCRGGMLICLYVDAFSRLGVYYMVMSYEIGEMRCSYLFWLSALRHRQSAHFVGGLRPTTFFNLCLFSIRHSILIIFLLMAC